MTFKNSFYIDISLNTPAINNEIIEKYYLNSLNRDNTLYNDTELLEMEVNSYKFIDLSVNEIVYKDIPFIISTDTHGYNNSCIIDISTNEANDKITFTFNNKLICDDFYKDPNNKAKPNV